LAEFTEKLQLDEPLVRLLFAKLWELIPVQFGRILSDKGAEALAKWLAAKLLDDSSKV